jgi:hypothetical protein
MRIIWCDQLKEFQAELSPGLEWQKEQQTAKSSGFKSTGPPDWIWRTAKASVLTKLRNSRVEAGLTTLTVTPDARAEYDKLLIVEAANASVLKQLKDAKKTQKKDLAESGADGSGFQYDSDGWAIVDRGDLPIWTIAKYKVSAFPTERCTVCQTPVYHYEQHDPVAVCLECEFSEDL